MTPIRITTASAMLTELHERDRIASASRTLAMLRSRDRVKEELRKFGVSPTHMAASEITSWARLYLEDHCAELMSDAVATIERWTREGVFGRRAQKAFIKHLQIEQSQSEESVTNGQS
jgi:hypothetical protein